MNTGDIVLLPFPFAELTNRKVGPAVVVCETKDKFGDLVLCAISSVVPSVLNDNEISLNPDETNKLRANSIIKVDRIVTLKTARCNRTHRKTCYGRSAGVCHKV